MNKNNLIPLLNEMLIPYCIYTKINTSQSNKNGITKSSTYISHIGAPELMVDDDGKNARYRCMNKSIQYEGWKPYTTFYTLSPQYRPIPKDMILLCAEWNRGFPYNTIDIKHVIDPYDINQALTFNSSCNFFYAYNRHIKGTTPLYLFKNDEGLFPTFEKDPPEKDVLNWWPADIPIIYVIVPENKLDYNGIKNIKFDQKNGTCFPSKNGKYNNINNCILSTNHKDLDNDNEDLLIYIKQLSINNNSKLIIFLIIFFFILVIFFIIIFFIKLRKPYSKWTK